MLQSAETMHSQPQPRKTRVQFKDETDVISYGIEHMSLTFPDGTPFYVSHEKFGEVQAITWVSDGSSSVTSTQSMIEMENNRLCVIEEHTQAIIKIHMASDDERQDAINELLQLIHSGSLKYTLVEKITASPVFKYINVLLFGAIRQKITHLSVKDAEKEAINKALRQSQTLTDLFEQTCWL